MRALHSRLRYRDWPPSGRWTYILAITEFEWDEAKSKASRAQRGFDFRFASRALCDPCRTVVRDRRAEYGEKRFRLLGRINGRVFVVIYTMQGSAIRIISARKANKREIREYEHNAYQN